MRTPATVSGARSTGGAGAAVGLFLRRGWDFAAAFTLATLAIEVIWPPLAFRAPPGGRLFVAAAFGLLMAGKQAALDAWRRPGGEGPAAR